VARAAEKSGLSSVHVLNDAARPLGRGFTVFMPLLFGEAGAPPATARLLAHVCISREFHCFAHNTSSPITTWLRALCAKRIRPSCPGPGIGAIGMCFYRRLRPVAVR
jgi:dienelactone hydrolase